MIKKIVLSVAACIALPMLSFAQDCDCAKPAKDPSVWDKTVSIGFNLTEGNSDTLLLNANAKASRDYQKNVWLFEIDGNYGESDSIDKDDPTAPSPKETTQQDLTGNAEYQRLLTERFYTGFGTKYKYDDIADIDYRVTLKPVVGYYLVKDDEVKLSVDVGPGYVFEKVGGIKDDYFAPRISDRFEWKISETAKLFQSAEYIFDVSESDNYQVVGEAGIEAAINSWLSLIVKAKDEYDNLPAAGKERNDFSLISGLALIL